MIVNFEHECLCGDRHKLGIHVIWGGVQHFHKQMNGGMRECTGIHAYCGIPECPCKIYRPKENK